MWDMQEGGRPVLNYRITVSGSLDQLIINPQNSQR